MDCKVCQDTGRVRLHIAGGMINGYEIETVDNRIACPFCGDKKYHRNLGGKEPVFNYQCVEVK